MMIPRDSQAEYIDVANAMQDHAMGKEMTLNILADEDLILDNIYSANLGEEEG